MEALGGSNRQSGLFMINRDKLEHINTDRPSYTRPSTMAATAVVSPTSLYGNGPPPPYSSSNWSANSHPVSGLISPPDSRRTSDNKNEPPPPIQTQQPHRQSLPSISEALKDAPASGPYASPLSASIPPPHQLPYGQSQATSIPRTYPPSDHARYSTQQPPQPRQPTPPQPIHPQNIPFSRPEPGSGSFSEISRHSSIPTLQAAPSPHNPYVPSRYESGRYETGRYEQDPRMYDRPPTGYSQPPPSQSQPSYIFGPPPHQIPTSAQPGPIFTQPRYDSGSQDPRDEWRSPKDYEKPIDPGAACRQGIKRHLDVYDFEQNLTLINVSSVELSEWSGHYSRIAGEQPRGVNTIPDRMPTLDNIEEMLNRQAKIQSSLERLREMIKVNQDQMREDQHLREQRGKGISYYDDEMSMYGDDMKAYGYGPEGKKRRGRAAPPGKCHSCNRSETPEWRRGPDGARTLCNACGLHYAKLTRKNTIKQSQTANVPNSLRPKSMDEVSPRPL